MLHTSFDLLENYCEQHSSDVGAVLNALARETQLKTTAGNMLSGPLQGQLLMLLSQLHKPKNILEIGTFTGYSAICMAQGLAADGQLHTIDNDREKEWLIRKYIDLAQLNNQITLHLGDAKAIIPTIDAVWDMVFIDADKENYGFYYDLIFDKVRTGGLIIADNVLWKGKVCNPPFDKVTSALHQFNQKIQADARVENVLLPLRDGLMLVRKK